jgi:hypothetical protein
MAPKTLTVSEWLKEPKQQGRYIAPAEWESLMRVSEDDPYAEYRINPADPYGGGKPSMRTSNTLLTNMPGSAQEFVGRNDTNKAILLMDPADYDQAQSAPDTALPDRITGVKNIYAPKPVPSMFNEESAENIKAMTPYDRMLYEQKKLYGGMPKEEAIFARAKVLTDQMLNKMDAYTASRLDYGTLYRQNIQNVAKSFEEQEKTLIEGMKAQAKEETELEKWMNRQRILAELEKKKEQKADLTESDKQQKERLAGYSKALALFNNNAGGKGEISDEGIVDEINGILMGSGNVPLQKREYGRYLPGTNFKLWQADPAYTMPPMPGRVNAGGPQPASPQGPPVNLLREGVHTRFRNNQVWTLRNGKPIQVE